MKAHLETTHAQLDATERGFSLALHGVATLAARITCFGRFVTLTLECVSDAQRHEVVVFGQSIADFLALIPSARVEHVKGCTGHGEQSEAACS